MSRPFLARRRGGLTYVAAAIAVLVAIVAAGLVAETASAGRPAESFRVPAPAPLPGAPVVGPGSAAVPSAAGPLTVLQGRYLVPGGVRVGFPDTLAGAVSAAVEYWAELAACLDPDRAALIGMAIADPSWPDAPGALANGVRNSRRSLGLPASGPVPAGASITFTAVEYQARYAGARQVTVLLLAYDTITLPGQPAQSRIGVYPAALRWDEGDWKILAPASGSDWSGLIAPPGSAQAAADGWQPLSRQAS